MSDGYRNGAFALGLVTGGGLVLNVFLWSAYRANKAREALLHSQEDTKSHPWINSWDWLIATFVDPYDTIAQWGMTLLSLVAVYLLWETLKAGKRTLKATQEMARETTRIGEAQSRAYVHADRAYFHWGGQSDAAVPRVEVWVRNTGQTPAKWYKIRLVEFVFERGPSASADIRFGELTTEHEFHGPWNAIPPDSEGTKATFYFVEDGEKERIALAAEDKFRFNIPKYGFSILGEIMYKTFFDEIYISQFAFGRGSLPAYRVSETRTREVDGVTINEIIEQPIPLARYAADLKTYERVTSDQQ